MSDHPKGISRRRFIELGAAGAAALSTRPDLAATGLEPDTSGPPLAVARMDPTRSYPEIPGLLQKYLNGSDDDAWTEIAVRIDYTYQHLAPALTALEAETGLGRQLRARLELGQRLLFKPNLVNTSCIDPMTHGPHLGSAACTEWAFVAALMRWFHDDLGVSYHRMTIGEAATAMPLFAGLGTMLNPARQPVTPEGLIEGRTGDFYFGWGFYFVRKYLAERLPADATDDPMRGYQESVAGTYIPPGLAGDRMMVYDLNRIADDPGKGRAVPVPDGVNYRTITLHKAIVGGDPTDAEDRMAYPGAVLVNVPKLKIHAISLLTNAIKNLGIGLYPMQSASGGGSKWDYAAPHGPIPGMKEPIPHQVWVPELDRATGLAMRDDEGRYRVRKTGGLPATMIDIVKAVANQDVLMVHVVDGIEAINMSHTGGGDKIPEGLSVAGIDPVATDLLCARYLFSNVPIEEAVEAGLEDGAGGLFPQKVPVAALDGGDIVTRDGYDCPLARDRTFEQAEQRGLGRRRYHVIGRDAATGRRLVSVQGHLGTLDDGGRFEDVYTRTLYFAASKVPWDLQRTTLSWMEVSDRLSGTSWRKAFLETYDEDGDGVVTYEEFGRRGAMHSGIFMGACSGSLAGSDLVAMLAADFSSSASSLRNSRPEWNAEGHDLYSERLLPRACLTAWRVVQSEAPIPDPRRPGRTVGQGRLPTVDHALEETLRRDLNGLLAQALAYADVRLNRAGFIGSPLAGASSAAVRRYSDAVRADSAKALDFTLYLPKGTAELLDAGLPNLEETEDRSLMFTMALADGSEILPGPAPFAIAEAVEKKKV
jgi:hypothetical protein